MGQQLKRIILLAAREAFYLGHVTAREERSHFFGESDDVGGKENRTKGARGVASTLGRETTVVTNDLNSITRLRERERVFER